MADLSTCPQLVPSSILAAHEKIKPYIHQTPLFTSRTLDRIASHPDPLSFFSSATQDEPISTQATTNGHAATTPKFSLYFKAENQQKIGAFKARGAFHALIHLIAELGIDEVRRRGVTTHSSGNHAQALAYAAFTFSVPSYIVMPTISTPSKIAGTKTYTDNVIFSGSTSVEREAKVKEVIKETDAILVPPYDHPDIILGQGTTGLEMERQFQELKNSQSDRERSNGLDSTTQHEPNVEESDYRLDAVITPLGGGGLLGGTATWFSHTTKSTTTNTSANKRTLVFGAEPSFSGANDAQIGLAQKPPTRVEHVKSLTIADGLRTPVGVINWDIISDKSKLEAVYSATEDEIKMALRLMMERVKVFVEPSAVVGVAIVLFCHEFRDFVARKQAEEGTGRPWDVGIVLSGGNTTVEALAKLFEPRDSTEEGKGERQAGQVGLDGEKKVEDVAG